MKVLYLLFLGVVVFSLRLEFPKDVTLSEEQINIVKGMGESAVASATAKMKELWNGESRRQLPPLPDAYKILEILKDLGKYETTKLFNTGDHYKKNKEFEKFWERFKFHFPTFSSKIVMDHDNYNTVTFKILGKFYPELIHLYLRHVDEESTEHETCDWPYGAGAFDPQIIECQHPVAPGKKYIVLRMETKIEFICMAIALETLLNVGWEPATTLMISASETHHLMDGGTTPWQITKEQDGDYQTVQYMQENGLVAESCVDELSFILPFYPLGDPSNPFYLPPALLIGTSQIGIDMFRIKMKIGEDLAISLPKVMNAYIIKNTTRDCDQEAENIIETFTEYLRIDPRLVPGLLDAVIVDPIFSRAACEEVITSYVHTNDYVHYPYNIVKTTYDRDHLNILVQVTYYEQDPTHSTEVFIGKLQPLIDDGLIEVDMVYRRPNRAKGEKTTTWYQTTSAVLHNMWDDIFPGVNVVPFKSPGSFDLNQYVNGGVCLNGYSFQHMFVEFTCPASPYELPSINIVDHGHGCGSMYSGDQVMYMTIGNAVNFMML